jgi:hypothetical protein
MWDIADGGVVGLPLAVRSSDGHTADEIVAVSRLSENRYLFAGREAAAP